ncbi:acetyltransferase [Rhizobium sp. RAF56]|jgi:hypothetical protein|uniref:acetyltransferase n=1 Tax=Rhizobium sp. RAF56 TaxID=3233062 RepID=UPI003F964356
MFQAFDKDGQQPLGPDEVSMMQGLITDYCRENSLDRADSAAQEAARHLLGWFQRGVTDRARLRELLHSRN